MENFAKKLEKRQISWIRANLVQKNYRKANFMDYNRKSSNRLKWSLRMVPTDNL